MTSMNLVMLAALLCVCAAGATAQFVELVVDRDAFAHVAAELASEVEEAAQAEQDACWKHVEWRGLGKFGKNGTCADNEEKEMGLCYSKCSNADADGEGPVCFDPCPAGLDLAVGAICCKDKTVCTQKVVDIAVKIPYDITRAAMDSSNPIALLKDIQKIIKDATELSFPECA